MTSLALSEYQRYLAGKKWAKRRAQVLRRDGGKCPCGARATQVHHRTYDRIYRERLEDLHAVCADCHLEIHERRNRTGERLDVATDKVLRQASRVKMKPRGVRSYSGAYERHLLERDAALAARREQKKEQKRQQFVPYRPNPGAGIPIKIVRADGSSEVLRRETNPTLGPRKKRAASSSPAGARGYDRGSTRPA